MFIREARTLSTAPLSLSLSPRVCTSRSRRVEERRRGKGDSAAGRAGGENNQKRWVRARAFTFVFTTSRFIIFIPSPFPIFLSGAHLCAAQSFFFFFFPLPPPLEAWTQCWDESAGRGWHGRARGRVQNRQGDGVQISRSQHPQRCFSTLLIGTGNM